MRVGVVGVIGGARGKKGKEAGGIARLYRIDECRVTMGGSCVAVD